MSVKVSNLNSSKHQFLKKYFLNKMSFQQNWYLIINIWMIIAYFHFFQCVEHGFPHKPSALAYDPFLKIMAIGTKTGTLKMYPL